MPSTIRDLSHDAMPFYEPGGFPTCKATGAVTGKHLVTISGNRTSGPGLSDTAEGGVYSIDQVDTKGAWSLGVAKRDAPAGGLVGVIASPGIIAPIVAGAAIAAGDEVIAAADGRVIPNDDDGTQGFKVVGHAMTAAASGADAEIKLV